MTVEFAKYLFWAKQKWPRLPQLNASSRKQGFEEVFDWAGRIQCLHAVKYLIGVHGYTAANMAAIELLISRS